jgi:hypothetical protein
MAQDPAQPIHDQINEMQRKNGKERNMNSIIFAQMFIHILRGRSSYHFTSLNFLMVDEIHNGGD